MKTELTLRPRQIIMSNKEKFEITQEEFEKIDLVLSSGKNKGMLKLSRSGVWINLAYMMMIKEPERPKGPVYKDVNQILKEKGVL